MGVSFIVISACLIAGLFTALFQRGPASYWRNDESAEEMQRREMQNFSPHNTFFIFGPAADNPACKLQRRLLKPAIAPLIRDDISIIEIYEYATPRRNGAQIDWLDAHLLRHAMNAQEGFCVVYVDEDGKTGVRREAPMLGAEILAYAQQTTAQQSGAHKLTRPQLVKKRKPAAQAAILRELGVA